MEQTQEEEELTKTVGAGGSSKPVIIKPRLQALYTCQLSYTVFGYMRLNVR
jgi:hypothetical protein